MLKDNSQMKLSLSPYQGIYDAVIPADHLLRRIKENIGFSFVNPMLRKQYCEKFGRSAKERSYSITQASEKNLERLKFERSEYFRERIKIRHRIEKRMGS